MTQSNVRAHKFAIPIKTEDDLRDFVWYAWGVRIPDTKVCPHHTTPWRAFADAYFARSSVSVWKGSRGFGGKSFTLACLGATEAATLKADVSILGGSGAQSLRVHEHMGRFWEARGAPRSLLRSDPTTEKTRLEWGNQVVALMASQTSVRGPHPQRLRMDEIDEMNVAILDAAMGQPMSGIRGVQTQTVMSSTHQYSNGTMTEILKRANEKGWPVYEWCYRETSAAPEGWLTSEEIERKRGEVTSAMWETEYDLQAPNPGARAIIPNAVEWMFQRELGEFRGDLHEYIEIEPPLGECTECYHSQPWEFTFQERDGSTHRKCVACGEIDTIRLYHYIHGADWARKNDWTIIPTFRANKLPLVCVAWERSGRIDWPVMIEKLRRRQARYGGFAGSDGTGLGDVIASYLPERQFDSIVMSGNVRSEMLMHYISEIESHRVVYPFIEFAYNEHLLASVEDIFKTGESFHLPDSISAGSLALSQYGRVLGSRLFVASRPGQAA